MSVLTDQSPSEGKTRCAHLPVVVNFNAVLPLMLVSARGMIERVNAEFTRLTGYSTAEVAGWHVNALLADFPAARSSKRFWRRLQDAGAWQGEVVSVRKGGRRFAALLYISAVSVSEADSSGYLVLLLDWAGHRSLHGDLANLALADELTGLPNRRHLRLEFENSGAVKASPNSLSALMYVDLDGFKLVNDGQGHEEGDRLLVNVARQLRHAVRASDFVARIGGDEFAVLINGGLSQDVNLAMRQVRRMAKEIQGAISNTALGEGSGARASIGIVVFRKGMQVLAALLSQADAAMYRAKRAGRNTVRVCRDRRERGTCIEEAQITRSSKQENRIA